MCTGGNFLKKKEKGEIKIVGILESSVVLYTGGVDGQGPTHVR